MSDKSIDEKDNALQYLYKRASELVEEKLDAKAKLSKCRETLVELKIQYINKKIKLPMELHALIEHTLEETK